jgi:uncharacterized protein (TIRG00374 family)
VTKQVLTQVWKYGLGLAVLGWVLWKNWEPRPGSDGLGLGGLLSQPLHPGALALALLIFLIGLLITFYRWFILVRAQGLPFSLANAVRLGLIGFFFNSFLPGSVGGDIIKAAAIAREQDRRTVAVATVLIDRAVGLWGLFCLVALLGAGFWITGNTALHTQWALQWIVLLAAGAVVASVACWLLLGVLPAWRAERFAGRLSRLPKVGHVAAEFWRAVWMYRCQRSSVVLGVLLSMVGHVCFVLSFYYGAQLFGTPDIPSLAEHYLLVPVGMMVKAGVPFPNGMGGGDWAFGELYALVGKDPKYGVAASLAQLFLTMSLGFIGLLVYVQMRPALRPAPREEAVPLAVSEVA